MSIKYLDVLEYVKKAKELKKPEVLAEYQAEKIESAIETAVEHVNNNLSLMRQEFNAKKLATLDDLSAGLASVNLNTDLKIANLRYDILKYSIRISVGIILTLGSLMAGMMTMMAHGFHWI